VFVDESAANERVGDRKRVWGPKGVGVINPLPFSKGEKFSILSAFTTEGFLSQHIIKGSFDFVMFFFVISDVLLPRCNPFPGKNSVTVMDNCEIHRHELIRETIEDTGCRLIILPSYSPDLNPIEISFGVMKSWIARNHISFGEAIIRDEMEIFFEHAMFSVKPLHAAAYVKKCGY